MYEAGGVRRSIASNDRSERLPANHHARLSQQHVPDGLLGLEMQSLRRCVAASLQERWPQLLSSSRDKSSELPANSKSSHHHPAR